MGVSAKVAIGIIVGLILSGMIAGIVIALLLDKHRKFVNKYSKSVHALMELNKRYSFLPIKKMVETHTYDNANFYDNISCQDYLTYQLQFKQKEVLQSIKDAKRNHTLYDKYMNEVNELCKLGEYECSTKHYILSLLATYEKREYSRLLQHPVIEFYISVTLYLSKINGAIYGVKRGEFYEKDIMPIIYALGDINGKFYRNRDIWDALCRVERGRVSNKMRFAVMKRDGNRCRYCGSTYNLEIDHIYPIAKGGKSTFDNLQTLCHRCNVEKGDRT